jgi:hypothetical protein
MTLIQRILDGELPETQEEIKLAYEHCDHIYNDCCETLTDHEVQEHIKGEYRALKAQASIARAKILKLLNK